MMDNILDVRNLIISFRTNNGTVKAVRDISFTMKKGETLAIVGESGSGKSVTARAIMGILAPNAIVEGGEIFYDGCDLLKTPEDEFHKLRGNRISMIFQDPLSSLNPIVRVGKQLTEAMILNGRANQRDAKHEYNEKIKLLAKACKEAPKLRGRPVVDKYVDEKIRIFRKFTSHGSKLERAYNAVHVNVVGLKSNIEGALIDIIHGNPKDIEKKVSDIVRKSGKCYHRFLINKEKSELPGVMNELLAAASAYADVSDNDEKDKSDKKEKVKSLFLRAKDIITKALDAPKVNFFTMGYYLLDSDNTLDESDGIEALNARMRTYIDENFMNDFLAMAAEGICNSAYASREVKRKSLPILKEGMERFSSDSTSLSEYRKLAKQLSQIVSGNIDRLSISKDSLAYTFETSIKAAVDKYLRAKKLSHKRHLSAADRAFLETADLERCRANIVLIVKRIIESYEAELATEDKCDYIESAVAMVDHLKLQASKRIYRVTRTMAKARAIELMEEVGISDARKRYRQYPFQFSGGMRQRIVIAIALAANPDIIICDEPTTALDVTIQAQILDLINKLKRERNLTVIFITHDLGVVANMADNIVVMYAGKIVEYGTVNDIFYEPAHPYTWALLSSMPDLDTKDKLEAIPGTPPNMIYPPKGDAFAPRNKYAMQIDFEEEPPMFEISPTHKAATWLLHPYAPKIDPPLAVTNRIARMKKLAGGVGSNE